MKDLIEQVAAGYSYNPVSWQDVAAYSLNQQSGQVRPPATCPNVKYYTAGRLLPTGETQCRTNLAACMPFSCLLHPCA